MNGSLRIAQNAPKILDIVPSWKSLELTSGGQTALAESAHLVRFGDAEGKVDTPITPAQVLQSRRRDDNGADLWRTLWPFQKAGQNRPKPISKSAARQKVSARDYLSTVLPGLAETRLQCLPDLTPTAWAPQRQLVSRIPRSSSSCLLLTLTPIQANTEPIVSYSGYADEFEMSN